MWYKYKKTLNTKATKAVEEHLQEAHVREVRRLYTDWKLGVTEDDGGLDIVD